MPNTASELMHRALDLAKRGQRSVSPNPMVGCVITNEAGKLIAEGWHQVFGGPHAEIVALSKVLNQEDLNLATVYVTLEPCAHFGKTPPCAVALAQLPIKKVVIACQDPNPEVAGKGIKILNQAGIVTEVGICEEEAKELNRAFFWRILNNRPYITLKWAETVDGFVARSNFESKWITSPISRAFVHKIRTEVDAVAVGGGTAFYDNPKLDVRNWFGVPPARIIIATQPQLPETHYLMDGSQRTILAWLGQGEPPKFQNIEVVDLSGVSTRQEQLGILLTYLCNMNIQHLLIEGGTKVLNQFIEAGLWNEAYVGKSKVVNFGQGIAAPTIGTSPSSMFELGPDLWSHYKNQSAK